MDTKTKSMIQSVEVKANQAAQDWINETEPQIERHVHEQLDVAEEDFDYDKMVKVNINNHLISEVFNELDLEVMLDSVGCIDHPA